MTGRSSIRTSGWVCFTVFTSALCIAIILIAAVSPAAAQRPISMPTAAGSQQSINQIREDYRLRVGALHVEPAIVLKELGVDTNVFHRTGDTSADFTTTVTPRAALAVPFANRALVKATLDADLVYFAKFASERSVDPQATVRGEVYAQRLTFFVEEAYLNTRERPNYEIDLRARHVQNDLTAGVAFRPAASTSVEVAARRGSTRFDGDDYFQEQRLKETLDRDTRVFGVTARYRRNGLTTVGLRYENQTDRFPLSPIRDTDSFRVMPGVELRPRALVSGSAWVGFRRFTPKASILRGQDILVAQMALSYTLLDATTFGVTYHRDYEFAFEALTPYFMDNSVGVFVRRAIGARFDVIVNVARHRYAFQSVIGDTPQSSSDRVDTTNNYGVNVGRRLTARTRLGFGLWYWTRDSTRRTYQNYNGLRMGLTSTYEF